MRLSSKTIAAAQRSAFAAVQHMGLAALQQRGRLGQCSSRNRCGAALQGLGAMTGGSCIMTAGLHCLPPGVPRDRDAAASPSKRPPMTPPLANSAAARDIANVLHPYTDLKTHQEVGPVVITRGKGVRVWDDSGKEYIESIAGLWCAALGFDNERLVQAAVTQMRKLPFYHAFTAKSHEPMIDLAEMLIARAP